jgi:hypothetical protein
MAGEETGSAHLRLAPGNVCYRRRVLHQDGSRISRMKVAQMKLGRLVRRAFCAL